MRERKGAVMTHRIRCFFLEPTGRVALLIHRYGSWSETEPRCPVAIGGLHAAFAVVGEEPERRNDLGGIINAPSVIASADPRWPACCACGYVFTAEDHRRYDVQCLYRRSDTGEELMRSQAPAGAMWYDASLDASYVPQGLHNLMVRTPGGDWAVDGNARNCGQPEDRRQEHHHCWIRHGEPPDITVDKSGGPTCTAGSGSIQCHDYHGFLRNGWLED